MLFYAALCAETLLLAPFSQSDLRPVTHSAAAAERMHAHSRRRLCYKLIFFNPVTVLDDFFYKLVVQFLI